MFIYTLIVFELVLVYVVFWYLYLHKPAVKRKIKGSAWGRYENSPYTTDGGDYYPPTPHGRGHNEPSLKQVETVHSFIPYQAEFVLNERTNRYVQQERSQAQSLLAKMQHTLDSTLGQLNVRD